MSGRSITIPAEFVQHITGAFGDEGRVWIDSLPRVVGELADQWALEVGQPFNLSYNYVVAVRRADRVEAVLKVSCPDPQLALEAHALRHYDGDGICRLLANDPTRDAMLLERLRPGKLLVPMTAVDDETATRIGARLMRRLFRPVPETMPAEHIRGWFERAFERHRAEFGGPGPLPAALFERGERLAFDLLDSAPADVLLHGDFHHFNILSAEREPWLAIDPKGMRGDPGYEVGAFLRNPDSGDVALTRSVLARRLDVFAEELELDRERLRAWGIAHAVLSAMWSASAEGQGWELAVTVGERLVDL